MEAWGPGTLYSLRVSLRLKQEQMAQKLGVARMTVVRWESGESKPDIRHQIKLDELAATRTVS